MAEPDDLVGETFVRAAKAIRGFSGDDDAARRWVFTLAHSVRVDAIRRASVRPVEPVASVVDVAPLPEPDEMSGHLMDARLIAALHQLTDLQREAVVLRHVGDLSLAQAAEIMGKSVGAVKQLQARGLAELAEILTTRSPGTGR